MPVQLTMKELHQLHAFHSDTLAYRASVPEEAVTAMLNNHPVQQEHAQKVLQALSSQYNRHYTLSNVRVSLLKEQVS